MTYHKDEIVLLSANPYHLGIVQADQASTRDDVLVAWLTGDVWMRPWDIVSETFYRQLHPAHLEPRRPLYDVLEPIISEQSLWEVAA